MRHPITILALAVVLGGCADSVPTVSLGIDDVYYIRRMEKLPLSPALTGAEYEWRVNGKIISTDREYIFIAKDEGAYNIEFKILDPDTPFDFAFTVHVLHEEIEYSPYISRVYDYCPAPGQFVNEMPRYEQGDTYADMVQKAEDCISGKNDIMITLGAYGGYVTFGFDHTVMNVPGEYDFRIWGNAFYELINPELRGGSCEPGIVWVSYDANCNGQPDDAWYELAGSNYHRSDTRPRYSLTYYAPDPHREIMADGPFINDANYVKWVDSDGAVGYVPKNIFHSQAYFPLWLDTDRYTLTGSCLPRNSIDTSGNGTYYVLYAFDWGYVDNHPNDYADLNSFNIEWAVDADGNAVSLPGADFIRVQTGINQYNGWIGETSTELSRAADLHVADPSIPHDPLGE